MFTGIVEELGEVRQAGQSRLSIRCHDVLSGTQLGDSIAVNGVCLTVTDLDGEGFAVDVMAETYARTALSGMRAGDTVNLERAAMLSTRLGGHMVQGHVDGVGHISAQENHSEWQTVHFAIPAGLSKYIVEKGSIAVDGVSLTVVSVDEEAFSVGLIPATQRATTLGSKSVSDPVHIEVDMIAKHVERLVDAKLAAIPGAVSA